MSVQKERIKIIADAAESRSGIIALLQGMDGYEVEVQSLDCGDYLVGDGCIVERKSNVDFFASILDGRFISQAKLMAEAYGRVVYLIEGDLNATPHNFTQASVHGALSFLAVLTGVSIIPSESPKASASLIATMARHCQQGLGYTPALRVSKPAGGRTAQLYALEGLPGVGGAKSGAILDYFGSVGKAFAASREEWLAMPGMGKASVDKIFAVIHAG